MAERRERAADQRSDDEDPEVGKRFAADEDSRSEAARRVDRCAGEEYAENVDERERKADYYTGDGAVAVLEVTPRMVSTNTKVRMTSTRSESQISPL